MVLQMLWSSDVDPRLYKLKIAIPLIPTSGNVPTKFKLPMLLCF